MNALDWKKIKTITWAPLALLTLAAFALRAFHLSLRSIWLDEAYSLRLAAADWRGIIQGAAMDIHPPLFHLILGGWIRLFGTSEFAARSLSALAGALLVPAVFKLAESLGGRRAAWWCAALTAVSPYFLELSRSARMGSLLALFTALAIYFFLQFLRGRAWGYSAGYVANMLAALFTHYFAFLLWFAQCTYLFMGIKQLKLPLAVRRRWLYLQFFIAAGLAPWLVTLWEHFVRGGPSWRGTGASWWEPLHSAYAFLLGTACWTPADKTVALGGLGLLALWLAWRLRDRAAEVAALFAPRDWGLLFTILVLPLALVYLYSLDRINVFDDRYLSMGALALLIALGGLLSLLSRRSAAVAIGLLVLAFARPVGNQLLVNGYYDDWRSAAARLTDSARPGDRVAVYPAWNETPLQYYLRGRLPVQGLPGTYDPITGETAEYFYIDRQSVHQLKSLFTSENRVWLVLVNDGEAQTALREWFGGEFTPVREERLGGIRLALFERAGPSGAAAP